MYIFQVMLNVIMKLAFCSVSYVSFLCCCCCFFCFDSDFSRLPPGSPVFVGLHMGPRVGFNTRIGLDDDVQVFYAFFQGWRQRHGLPELDLNTKQQQLVSWRNAGVSAGGFCLFFVV